MNMNAAKHDSKPIELSSSIWQIMLCREFRREPSTRVPNTNEEKIEAEGKMEEKEQDRQMSSRSVQNNVSVDIHLEEENDYA